MRESFYFIFFVISLIGKYCIYRVSEFVALQLCVTGSLYWSVVIVMFLVLDSFCFGAYDLTFLLGSNDEIIDEWESDE